MKIDDIYAHMFGLEKSLKLNKLLYTLVFLYFSECGVVKYIQVNSR